MRERRYEIYIIKKVEIPILREFTQQKLSGLSRLKPQRNNFFSSKEKMDEINDQNMNH